MKKETQKGKVLYKICCRSTTKGRIILNQFKGHFEDYSNVYHSEAELFAWYMEHGKILESQFGQKYYYVKKKDSTIIESKKAEIWGKDYEKRQAKKEQPEKLSTSHGIRKLFEPLRI